MKKIYALYASKDKGKSETIKLLFDKLKVNYPKFEVLEIVKPIYGADIRVIIKINGKIIGIESQGDPDSRIFNSLPLFIKIEADIIICATRTKGATVDIVEQQKKKYDITWIKKEASTSESKYHSDNSKTAENLLKRISEEL